MGQKPPKNYLVESILVTIFCCLPFGIAGIVFASQVNSKFALGDYEGAIASSKRAKKWMNWSIIAAVISVILSIVFVFALGGLAILGLSNQ
ncbi:CD225/dispanin family protein [Lutibacter sp.]|uniref:CD225/dispanin family protein n=1 Tax=Lutibacter sp. TaxID=1925666 RepID=UPI0025BC0A30|nr:CD225/dispanin family protein [Lutibacter sp.]MCF6182193.1 CD225/dispanin family protein [Lutibacter sp.]